MKKDNHGGHCSLAASRDDDGSGSHTEGCSRTRSGILASRQPAEASSSADTGPRKPSTQASCSTLVVDSGQGVNRKRPASTLASADGVEIEFANPAPLPARHIGAERAAAQAVEARGEGPQPLTADEARAAAAAEGLELVLSLRGETSFKGVSKNHDKYTAKIRENGKQRSLGTFVTPEEAALCYARYIGAERAAAEAAAAGAPGYVTQPRASSCASTPTPWRRAAVVLDNNDGGRDRARSCEIGRDRSRACEIVRDRSRSCEIGRDRASGSRRPAQLSDHDEEVDECEAPLSAKAPEPRSDEPRSSTEPLQRRRGRRIAEVESDFEDDEYEDPDYEEGSEDEEDEEDSGEEGSSEDEHGRTIKRPASSRGSGRCEGEMGLSAGLAAPTTAPVISTAVLDVPTTAPVISMAVLDVPQLQQPPLQPSKAPRQPEQPLQPQQPVAPQPPPTTAPLPPQQPTSFVWVPPTPPRQLLPVPVLAREGCDHHHPPLLAGRPLTLPQSLPVSQPQHEQVPQQLLAPQQASQPRSTQQFTLGNSHRSTQQYQAHLHAPLQAQYQAQQQQQLLQLLQQQQQQQYQQQWQEQQQWAQCQALLHLQAQQQWQEQQHTAVAQSQPPHNPTAAVQHVQRPPTPMAPPPTWALPPQ